MSHELSAIIDKFSESINDQLLRSREPSDFLIPYGIEAKVRMTVVHQATMKHLPPINDTILIALAELADDAQTGAILIFFLLHCQFLDTVP